ncbi:DM13 domain-containing protein, partial [Mycobacterium sp. NPDC003449]
KGVALLTLALALTACGTSTTDAQSSSQASPSQQAMMQSASSARTGTFEGLNDKHVAGKVNIAAGELVLSDFSSDESPDLHIYLTNGTDPSAVAAGKGLGSVAFDKASQTFSISGVDASKYDTVLISDDKAHSVLGAAKLA